MANFPALSEEQRTELASQLEYSDGFVIDVQSGPTDEDPARRWSVRVALGGAYVILREPVKGCIVLDRGERGPKGRVTTGEKDINRALIYAEEWLTKIFLIRRGQVVEPGIAATPTLSTVGQANDLFRQRCLPDFEPKYRLALTLGMDLVESKVGRGSPLKNLGEEKFVNDFITWRTKGTAWIVRNGKRLALAPVEPVTALANLQQYSSVLTHLQGMKNENSEPLIPDNPLKAVLPEGPEFEKRLGEPATDEQYLLLMTSLRYRDDLGAEIVRPAPVDAVDSKGIVRCALALYYHTGRRREAVLHLRMRNIILSTSGIRQKLKELKGPHNPKWAPTFPHGIIEFEAEHDKNGFHLIFPISRDLRRHLDHYLSVRAKLGHPTDPNSPLFPRPSDSGRCFSENTMFKQRSEETYKLKDGKFKTRKKKGGWYVEAVHTARDYLEEMGRDPDEVMPIDEGQAQPWRRLWATKIEHLGYGKVLSDNDVDLDRHAKYMGSWSLQNEPVKGRRYVHLDPNVLMAIAAFEDATRVLGPRGTKVEADTAAVMAAAQAELGGDPICALTTRDIAL